VEDVDKNTGCRSTMNARETKRKAKSYAAVSIFQKVLCCVQISEEDSGSRDKLKVYYGARKL
jgi:hypothetical protein